MTKKKFEEIMGKGIKSYKEGEDDGYMGFNILAKYTNNILQGADHDIIYSENVDKLIEAGITEEEVLALNAYGWHIQDSEYIAHSV